MPCFSYFCCGYTLRTGGQVIGYVSLLIYALLSVLCVIFLWCIKNRIDEGQSVNHRPLYNHVTQLLRLRSSQEEIENSIQELKIYSIIILVYLLFLLLGFLTSSTLITASKLRKPNQLLWWLIYQILFIVATAGIVILLITIKDERYGLLSYIKNYVLNTLVLSFVIIFITFATLLIYFWLMILSLRTSLVKFNQRNSKRLSQNQFNEIKPQTTFPTSNTISRGENPLRLIPIDMANSQSMMSILGDTENNNNNSNNNNENEVPRTARFYILHV